MEQESTVRLPELSFTSNIMKAFRGHYYIPVRSKFYFCVLSAVAWTVFCLYIAAPWISDLASHVGMGMSLAIVLSVAIVPGFMYMFLTFSLLFDKRPPLRPLLEYPPVSVLVPAFNEGKNIRKTLESIYRNEYPEDVEIIVIDDGSTDQTPSILSVIPFIKVISGSHGGKARALNLGLAQASYDLIVTVDSDTYLQKNALKHIVERLHADPPNTVAVAGSVLVRNSRKTVITRLQELDYFHGISSIKRMQSLFQGTLVVQGAFSLYRREALVEVGGWKPTVGEDIVLTWELLSRGYRTGFAENAIGFTTAPQTYAGFFRQRKRWARGMIEGFKYNPRIITRPRLSTFFIFWNTLFPVLDAAYLCLFIPGVILALFGYYFIAGPMTLFVLPLSLLVNALMFAIQRETFTSLGLRVRKNYLGFILYILAYQFLLAPASVNGYAAEIFNFKKTWGTR